MAEDNKLPLLIKGFFENANNQTGSTIIGTPSNPQYWENKIQEGRGDVEMIDIVSTNVIVPDGVAGGVFDLNISSYTILQQQIINRYYYNAFPRSYEYMYLVQPPGQTLSLEYLATTVAGVVVHCYHTNRYNNEKVWNARKTASLKQKIIDFTSQPIAFNQRIYESEEFTVPVNVGNVVAIEINTYNDVPAVDAVQCSLLTLQIDGVNVIENAAAITFYEGSTRPGLLLPMVIRGGTTFKLFANTSNATGGSMVVNMRLYFDDDVKGMVKYD